MKINIGVVLKSQGIKGELKCSCALDDAKMLHKVKQIYLQNTIHNVVSIRCNGAFFFVKLQDICDKNTAETYRGYDVFCEKDDLHLDDGRYFIDDIIGCRVTLTDGKTVGVVVDVLQYGAADVYVCKCENGEVSFPVLKDLVVSIDVQMKSIVLSASRFSEVAVYNEN